MSEENENGVGHVDGFDEGEALEQADIVTIADDDGSEHECALLLIVDHNDASFALLAPVEQLKDDEGDTVEMFICRIHENEDGMPVYSDVGDDELYGEVQDIFTDLLSTDEEDDD